MAVRRNYWCGYYFLVVMVGVAGVGGLGGGPNPVLLSSRALELSLQALAVRDMPKLINMCKWCKFAVVGLRLIQSQTLTSMSY